MPTPIPSDVLARMRVAVANTFDATCDILRNSSGTSWGGEATSWPAVATGIPCRAAPSPRLPHEATVGGKEESKQFWLVAMAPATGPSDPTSFTAKDRLRVTFPDGVVLTFEITAPIDTRSIEVGRRAVCELLAQ